MQITSPANKEWTLNPNVLSRHITVQRLWNRKIDHPNFFRSSTAPGKHRSCLLLHSVARRAFFWRHVEHAVCLELSPDRPLSFSASLSSFIECNLPAKKHNCVCHIITEPFYPRVQIGILLGVYMPSNLNYDKRWDELNVSATLAGWSTFCAAEELFIKFSIPPCAAVDMTMLLTVSAVYTNNQCVFATRALISVSNAPRSGVGADALLARIKDLSLQRIMRVLIVLLDIYHSPLLNCKGHRQTKTKQYLPNHDGEILNRSF